MITYKVTSNESSLADKVFSTEQEAENCIREYNEEDKKNGCYTSGYWIIKEEEDD